MLEMLGLHERGFDNCLVVDELRRRVVEKERAEVETLYFHEEHEACGLFARLFGPGLETPLDVQIQIAYVGLVEFEENLRTCVCKI